MKRPGWEAILLVAALVVLVVLAIADGTASRARVSTYSTYDTGPNGYRALYETLLRERVPVRRFERPIGLLDRDVHTLVISSWSRPDRIPISPLDANDRKRLQRFVRSGGTLIVADDIATSLLVGFGLDSGRIYAQAPGLRPVIASLGVTRGVARVEGTVRVLYRFNAQRAAIPLLGSEGGIAALERTFGNGRIIVITAPDIFSNAYLAKADNARFAFQLLARNGPIAFDESVHGYAQDKSFWAALPVPVHVAVWLAIAILLLLLVDANVRFAPAIPLEAPDERDSSAYIASMATLLERARAGKAVVARLVDDAVRRTRRRFVQRDDVELAVAELESLRALERPSDADVLRAAQLYTTLRKDLA